MHAGRVHSLSESPFAGMIRIRFCGCDLSSSARKNTPAVWCHSVRQRVRIVNPV